MSAANLLNLVQFLPRWISLILAVAAKASKNNLLEVMEKSRGSEKFPIEIKSVIPKKRDEKLNVNGWGFKDSFFTCENGVLYFSGDR